MLPISYYPLSVALVDDSEPYLYGLKVSVSREYPVIPFLDSDAALAFLSEKDRFSVFSEKVLVKDGYTKDQSSSLNIKGILKEAYNRGRFNSVGVLVTDYEMPGLDGLELCQRLKDTQLKKVMLTGAGDINLAYKALNDGIINKFYFKANEDIVEFNKMIFELQWQLFSEQTKSIRDHLSDQDEAILLTSSAFEGWFLKIRDQYDIVEHYLTSEELAFILIARNGDCYCLHLVEDARLTGWSNELQHAEGDFTEILPCLTQKTKMPLLVHNDLPFDEWEKVMSPCNPISFDGKDYFYSMERTSLPDQGEEILSYEQALKAAKEGMN